MFHDIPAAVASRMEALEARDLLDRSDGTPIPRRLRQIPPQTGRLLAILAAGAPRGDIVEIGTSGGYSTLWLGLAATRLERRITTYERDPAKVDIARETFRLTGMDEVVDLIAGDAAGHLPEAGPIGFCFLDAEKEDYRTFYDAVVPMLVPGGLLVADNILSHRESLMAVADAAMVDARVDAVVVPSGTGLLICRRTGVPMAGTR